MPPRRRSHWSEQKSPKESRESHALRVRKRSELRALYVEAALRGSVTERYGQEFVLVSLEPESLVLRGKL